MTEYETTYKGLHALAEIDMYGLHELKVLDGNCIWQVVEPTFEEGQGIVAEFYSQVQGGC